MLARYPPPSPPLHRPHRTANETQADKDKERIIHPLDSFVDSDYAATFSLQADPKL